MFGLAERGRLTMYELTLARTVAEAGDGAANQAKTVPAADTVTVTGREIGYGPATPLNRNHFARGSSISGLLGFPPSRG